MINFKAFAPTAAFVLTGCSPKPVQPPVAPSVPAAVTSSSEYVAEPAEKAEPPPQPTTASPQIKINGHTISYSPQTDPFAANERIKKIAREILAQPGDPVQNLFDRLNVNGPEGVTSNTDHRFGTTASETLVVGGDCSDLSNLTIATIKAMNHLGAKIEGGAFILQLENFPPDTFHMVPYVEQNGKRIILDLQAARLGETAPGKYKIVQTFPSFDEAASLYHSEWGDYFKRQGQRDRTIAAYTRAIQIYGGYPTYHDSLARAQLSKLDDLIQQAVQNSRWDKCITHTNSAFKWVQHLPQDEQESILQQLRFNIDTCQQNKQNQTQSSTQQKTQKVLEQLSRELKLAYSALTEGRNAACIDHYKKALQWNSRLAQDEITRQRAADIQNNLQICRDRLR